MNKNFTKLCVVRPLKGAPMWLGDEMNRFQDFVSELPNCRVLDFLKRNNVAGRDPYELERECMERSHLVIFLPECSSTIVGALFTLRLECFKSSALVLASRDVHVSETITGLVKRNPGISLFERYGNLHSLMRDGIPLVEKALDHFKPQIDAMKKIEQKQREQAEAEPIGTD
ncbi:MAG TPA: hypothetical protein VMR73_00080 [Candidatus Paceibacterota bacterium]|nr:hypothetical protein [Candidatus Paceibacterota bacterium]